MRLADSRPPLRRDSLGRNDRSGLHGWGWWLDATYPGNLEPLVREQARRLRMAWFKTLGFLALAILLLAWAWL